MDDKSLKKEFESIQKRSAPDLWSRIEPELRPLDRADAIKTESAVIKKRRRVWYYSGAAAAALLFLVVMVRINNQSAPDLMQTGITGLHQTAATVDTGITAGERNTTFTNREIQAADGAAQRAENLPAGQEAKTKTPLMNTLQIPQNAVTIPADAAYFSEDLLREAELLCNVTVSDISFAYDSEGKAISVIYQVTLHEIYYTEYDILEDELLTVSSPIIETGSDEAYLLFQMQQDAAYLLPLRYQNGWELLYPFAPQIEIFAQQSFLFHSGYASLINERTNVAKAESEGENDFYFDRMLMRTDDSFIDELISLIN